MSLPLLTRANADGVVLMPPRAPLQGEQYRFHVDMGSCIGCKCCVVACNEQNDNPAAINWRRVAEVEGGWFPNTRRAYLSMGCNHCVNPTCLSGCPVDAYTKDAETGIVQHSADACIGCQYCTWTCSYGVPQYNPASGVVGKCDMCSARLQHGQTPACVSACPEGAIQIEVVRAESWRTAFEESVPGRGVPAADGSMSTTRVTMPKLLPPNTEPVGGAHVGLEPAHWSLVIMTVLTQLSVGAFVTIWMLHLLGATTGLVAAAVTSLVVVSVALGGATLHLGRPAYAWRALKAWRHSWLSREVLLFTIFTIAAAVYTGMLWFGLNGAALVGGLTSLLGVAGVTVSGCIYRVPSRPAWNTPLTLVQFNLTAGAVGPLLAAAVVVGDVRWVALLAAGMATAQLGVIALRFFRLVTGGSVELEGSARLLSTRLRMPFLARGVLLLLGGIVVPLLTEHAAFLWASLAMALVAEILGRYLFFVSAVPSHMTAPYLELGSKAA
jgi:formate dehydrogenase iron-sulfur subunit